MARVLLSGPDVGVLEAKYVLEAIASGWAAPAGPDLAAFEAEMTDRIGVAHAVAVSSGTAALHLALVALGIGPGDIVLTSSMTFAATANAITYTGAEPYFVDCERETGNIDVNLLRETVLSLSAAGERIGALVPVDLLGKCADMDALTDLADQLGLALVVDAAESLGARFRGRAAGRFGRASILSFNGNKIVTTSGGGMLLTAEQTLADRVRYLSTQARQPVTHYEHTDIGYNYRLSNILAAMGRAQLCRLDDMLERRRVIRQAYRALFTRVPGVEIFDGGDDREDSCWLTSVVVEEAVAGWSAADLQSALQAVDIESRPLWKPMHLQPVYVGARAAVNGHSEWLFTHGLTLPSGSAMSDAELHRVLDAITDFVEAR